ncbi:MAG: hypothetical protein OEZ34_08005 [Spirochaetia bacterium]|nr:hypothetical protein [Spirochaetia bacterium]
MKILRYLILFFILSSSILSGASCRTVSQYQPPLPGEPMAIVKLHFNYAETLPIAWGNVISASIQEGEITRENKPKWQILVNYPHAKLNLPGREYPEIAIQAFTIRAGMPTRISMRLAFYWYTTETRTVTKRDSQGNSYTTTETYQQYHERGCTEFVKFESEPGKIYYLNYNNISIDQNCPLKAHLQELKGDQKFVLKPVGSPYVPKTDERIAKQKK